MKTLNQIVTDGTPKGEMIILAAKSNVRKPAFPPRLIRTSSKLTDVKNAATGGCIIGFLHLVIFIAKFAEWFWNLLPDKCKVNGCRRMGIRGNENRIEGSIICDYCLYLQMCEQNQK